MFISRCRCSRLLSSMFAVLLLVGLAGLTSAQSVTGSVSGTVTATGGVVVGAGVTLHLEVSSQASRVLVVL